jgi:uncharacterized membrane protein HdeD (DUF308 family)
MSAHALAQNWWLIVLRGLLAVLFGLAALIWPNLALGVLVLLFGLYWIMDGLMAVVAGLTRQNGTRPWWLLPVEGLFGILAGVLSLFWPGLTAMALLYLIAAWAILTGLVEIVSAIQLRAEIENEWLLALGGVVSVALGMMLVIWPGAGLVVMVRLMGAYALIYGFLLIGLGFRLWNWQNAAHLLNLRPAWVNTGRHPRTPLEK